MVLLKCKVFSSLCMSEKCEETKHVYLNHASCAHNLFVYSKHVKVAVCRPCLAHFSSFGGPWKFVKQTVNMARRLQFINRHIRFDKFVNFFCTLFVPSSVIYSYNVDKQNTPVKFNIIFHNIFYVYVFWTWGLIYRETVVTITGMV